jgi:transposase-like protein
LTFTSAPNATSKPPSASSARPSITGASQQRSPWTVEASHQAVASLKAAQILPKGTKVRSNKYLNNLIEQNHRPIKQRTRPMLGFKNYANARRTLAGIELADQIRKGQFVIDRLKQQTPEIADPWLAVLAA